MNKHPGPGKRWEKGQSGNPKGGPKRDTSWKRIFQDLLSIKDVRLPEGTLISRKKAIAIKVVHLALAGDIQAANFIAKFTEPSEPLKIQHVDENGRPAPAVAFIIQKQTLDEWKTNKNRSTSPKSEESPLVYRAT